MLELRIVQITLMKKLLGLVGGMADGAILYFSSTGLSIQAEDKLYTGNHVMIYLSSNFFEFYLCEEEISICSRLHAMSRIMNRASDGDTITIKVASGSDTVSFTIERPGKTNISAEMKLPEDKNEHFPILEGPYEVTIKMASHNFAQVYSKLLTLYHTDRVIISLANKKVKFSNEVDDIGHLDINWLVAYVTYINVPDFIATVNTNLIDPVSFAFRLKRIWAIMQAASMSINILIRMSSGLPVVLEYMIEEVGCIRFYLS